jgi:DNA-binding transcriptional ArsR family regulator
VSSSRGRGASRARDPAAELAELDLVFKALAHASRRQILLVLHFRGGTMTAGEIAARFACTWPTTSRHLKVLREAGLVRVEERGRERVHRLDAALLRRTVGGWLAWLDEPPAG